ncbi:hypothetical protein RND81_09G062400 [Saponaria officinalis]|uniref:Protein FAR1-RELATED SEQUENCE n=1 Tax=Saponaria officinalis TaxID=3572 RepID=A0AAW1IIM7_SAPOF
MSKISSIVWDIDLEPEEFEEKWGNVISEHSLQDNPWLSYMFGIRERWIPAYFRDLPLGCLLRTTQRSESENSYFKRFENHFGTLVEFSMRFTSAMEQQRHTQRQLYTKNKHAMSQTITPLKLEKHDSVIYTHAVFSEFQEEVRQSVCSLGIAGFNKNGNMEYHDVDNGVRIRKYRVEYNAKTKMTAYGCKLFERRGFICRHILWVWAGRKMYSIRDDYILPRWTKKSYRPIVCDSSGKVDEDIDEADIRRVEMSKA